MGGRWRIRRLWDSAPWQISPLPSMKNASMLGAAHWQAHNSMWQTGNLRVGFPMVEQINHATG